MPEFSELSSLYVEALQGIAYLDGRLYTVSTSSNQITVYFHVQLKSPEDGKECQCISHVSEEDITLNDLIYPSDLTACSPTNSLFVCDSGAPCIFKICISSKTVTKLFFGAEEKLAHISCSEGQLVVTIFIQDGINFLEIYSTVDLVKLFRVELESALWVHRAILKSNGHLLLCWTKNERGQMALLSEMVVSENSITTTSSTELAHFKYEFDVIELRDTILLSDTCDNSIKVYSSDLEVFEKVTCPEGQLKVYQPSLMTSCRDQQGREVVFLVQMTSFRNAEQHLYQDHSKNSQHMLRMLKII